MATYSIKDIEHLSGIKAHTIRIWEKRYNILEPKRTDTNIRYYDDEDLKRILNISVLNKYGYKISKIATLPEERLNRELLNVTQTSGVVDGQIENLIVAMIDFDEAKFEKVFSKCLMSYGFEETIIQVIYPFFEKIGILWTTGNINPAQEHFISNLIRQKLIVAIDDLPVLKTKDSKSFMLFLPEGEWHELGLLFFTYILKKKGHLIIYLGSSLPLDSVLDMEKFTSFDYMVTTVKTSISAISLPAYLTEIADMFPDKTIYLLGAKCQKKASELPSNIALPDSLKEFKQLLNTLG
jgi:DNA-binding transcriptional MerR regulator